MGKATLWRYITGERGVNRIRVYERRPGGPISVEWYDRDGRHQKTLTKLAGQPLLSSSVHDRELAKELADRMAAAQRKKREAQVVHRLVGTPIPHTLGELLEAYENANPDWSPGHRRDQVVNRRYWEHRLGKDRLLTSISPAVAAQAVQNDAAKKKRGFSKRTQQKRLQYLKDTFNFARRHLKWITEADDLSALDVPKPDGESKSYNRDEVRAILSAAERVDYRCAAAAYIAAVSGRRVGAIRALTVDAYSVETVNGDEVGVLQFRGETDKARRTGIVYLIGRAKTAVERLLATPAVKSSGLMFVAGDLNRLHPPSTIITYDNLRDMLREAEQLAGVESVPGRAYHGFKRRYATEALRLDPQAASKQSGTTLEMLRRVYEQDDPDTKIALARGLEQTLGGGA